MTVFESPYLIEDYYILLQRQKDGIRCKDPLALLTPLAESHLFAAFLDKIR
jgi:hypothetical protein